MSIEETKGYLKVLQAEVVVVRRRIKEVEEELGRLKTRSLALHGSVYGGGGELYFASQRLKQAELEATDAVARKVMWVDNKQPYQDVYEKFGYIVDKITPKRIFVRCVGHERCYQYNKDGTVVSGYKDASIDINKTFPEGLDEYEKANKQTRLQ